MALHHGSVIATHIVTRDGQYASVCIYHSTRDRSKPAITLVDFDSGSFDGGQVNRLTDMCVAAANAYQTSATIFTPAALVALVQRAPALCNPTVIIDAKPLHVEFLRDPGTIAAWASVIATNKLGIGPLAEEKRATSLLDAMLEFKPGEDLDKVTLRWCLYLAIALASMPEPAR